MGTGAALLNEARTRAGLSRRALAARAGVAASTVTRIEDGAADPTVSMLERLLAAAGSRLVATVAMTDDPPTVASLATAVDEVRNRVRIDWTRLRGVADYVARHPGDVGVVLDAPPARTGTILDPLLAAFAEELADHYGVARPKWTRTVGALADEWSAPMTPRRLADARANTPEPFARRRLVLARTSLFRA